MNSSEQVDIYISIDKIIAEKLEDIRRRVGCDSGTVPADRYLQETRGDDSVCSRAD